jgi:DNA-binding transcriptional LysR family regulator
LTEAGAGYLARIEPILAALDEASQAARGTGELRGVLRVGLSPSLAVRELIPRLPSFMKRHPVLRIDLLMSDQRQDLLTEGVDVALRFGSLPDSTAVARRISAWPRVLVASPTYLANAGVPDTPADLPGHALIVGPSPFEQTSWSFCKEGRSKSIRVEGYLMVNVYEGATAAAVAGLGIAAMPRAACDSELMSGRLVRALPDWEMGSIELHAVLPTGRSAKWSARAFVDYLVSGTDWAENTRADFQCCGDRRSEPL